MRKVWIHFTLFLTLLFGGAFGAFIQSPIPPSSKQNYYRDVDGNGRLDRIDIKFLGLVSEKYIDDMLDSLAFDWIDSLGEPKHYVALKSDFSMDSTDRRLIHVNLDKRQQTFAPLTALATLDYSSSTFGSASLYLSDSTVFSLNMKDGMAPSIAYAHLRSRKGKGVDSLKIKFTEMVQPVDGCNVLLEYKVAKDTAVKELAASMVHWNLWGTEAVFEFNDEIPLDERLSPRDSLRLLKKCMTDSAANVTTDGIAFFPVKGFYPLDVSIPSLTIADNTPVSDDIPVFQTLFESAEEVSEDSLWELSMEAMGDEFDNALRENLGVGEKFKIDRHKLKIHFNVRIYTNLGSYVVGTQSEIMGDDDRFANTLSRIKLRWNYMDSNRRRVGTGAYLANILVTIEYDGKTVFRNDRDHGTSAFTFGVKRR